jgi:hypothetical protein
VRIYEGAPRKRAPARGKRGAAPAANIGLRLLKAAVTPILRKPASAFAGLLLTGFAATIVVNAVALQPRAHPAPLFGADRGRAIEVPAKPAAPAAQPTASAQTAPASPPQILPPARPEREAQPTTTAALPPARPDLIGQLIRGGNPAATSNAAPVQASATLLNVQRALVKLGYSLKPDGVMGPATQHAIESFEQQAHLPVTGALNPRMLKSLATASGMPVE